VIDDRREGRPMRCGVYGNKVETMEMKWRRSLILHFFRPSIRTLCICLILRPLSLFTPKVVFKVFVIAYFQGSRGALERNSSATLHANIISNLRNG
jgi:hypothetical protein